MIPNVKVFFLLKLLDVCELPAVGVTVEMREALDGSCAASVRYLAPERDAYYSSVDLGPGNLSVATETETTPALGFIEPAVFEDAWLLGAGGFLTFETAFAPTQILQLDVERCSCR